MIIFKILFAIIPIVLVVFGVITYFLLFHNRDLNSNNLEGNNSSLDSTNSSQNNKKIKWDTYSVFIDGIEIKLPMKYHDFEALGFKEMSSKNGSVLKAAVYSKESLRTSNLGGDIFGLFTNGITSNIDVLIYNDSDEAKELQDCYVIGISIVYSYDTQWYFTIGEIRVVNNTNNIEAIVGVTKYDDIASNFGNHYVHNYSNVLTYYPDLDSNGKIDMSDIDIFRSLDMYFDQDTKIFDYYDFYYSNIGDLDN